MCIYDVIGKELLWHDVRQVRGQQFEYFTGVYWEVDEREAFAQYR